MSRIGRPQARWTDEDKLLWMVDLASRFVTGSFTWDPANVNANTTSDQTLTSATYPALSGLRTGMYVHVTPPSTLDAALVVGGAWIPADDQLTIRLRNLTAGPINQASATWAFLSFIL